MSDTQYFIGQRYISNSEGSLGLGVIMSSDHRSVNILFPAVNEERTYAKSSAHLTRLVLGEGEKVKHVDGFEMIVTEVLEQDNLLTYVGTRLDNQQQAHIVEVALDANVKLNQPEKRLMHGQLDDPQWFDTRYECYLQQNEFSSSGVVGLLGARVDLIPHQIHIANEVGKRYAPRVLLADEVGLGKTIEAALIMHMQLVTGRAQRVMIVVPDSLVHQWLVEMLRRVNLAFSVFDDERIQAVKESGENPFEQEQLVLCSLSFITQNEVLKQACECTWDMLVVDEAHHLEWSEQAVSAEYSAIEQLSGLAKSVLLLTATPDQLGHKSHFARLRLLDSARFYDYDAFLEQEQKYSELANACTPLVENAELDPNDIDVLAAAAPNIDLSEYQLNQHEDRQQLLHRLVDQHGTGRLLFRNRRAAIKGFPERICHPKALRLPKEYALSLMEKDDVEHALHPERSLMTDETWPSYDPRVAYLVEFLEQNKQEKVLVICAYASTTLQVAEFLRAKTSIRHTVFHENMSIVERDKAAHYFSETDKGAQVMLCSEIGSEGRNFQFSRHLVLFDLPLNPDLLEQRIGRLDRIGQKYDINIHIPYFENTAQDILFQWYNTALGAFEATCPVGTDVYKAFKDDLLHALASPDDNENWQDVLSQAQQLKATLSDKIEQGRDRLLELNASGSAQSEEVLEQIVYAENPISMLKFMTRLFDSLGITQEEKDAHSFILKQTENAIFPIAGINDEGLEVTYKRETATQLEHLSFLNPDSALVNQCIESVLSDVIGKSSLGFVNNANTPVGAYWIEIIAVLNPTAPKALQLYRYLPASPVKVCLDAKLKSSEETFSPIFKVKPKVAKQLLTALAEPINATINAALNEASEQLELVKKASLINMHHELDEEINRLKELKQVNPAIRDDEIDFLEEQKQQLTNIIEQAEPVLDSVRVLVNNPK